MYQYYGVVSLIGSVGSGKTTFFKKLFPEVGDSKTNDSCKGTQLSYDYKDYFGGVLRTTFYDTPGFGRKNKLKRIDTILKSVQKSLYILVVVKYDEYEQMIMNLEPIINMFYPVKENIIIVVTHMDLCNETPFPNCFQKKVQQNFNVTSVMFISNQQTQVETQLLFQETIQNNKKPSSDYSVTPHEAFLFSDWFDFGQDMIFEMKYLKNQFITSFKKKIIGFEKFIDQVPNQKIKQEVLYPLPGFIKSYANQSINQFIEDNFKLLDELSQYVNHQAALFVYYQIKREVFNIIKKLISERIQRKILDCQYYPFLRKCPYCGMIWFKVTTCGQSSTVCGALPDDNEPLESPPNRFKYFFEGDTLMYQEQQLNYGNTQIRKFLSQRRPDGCQKSFDWDSQRCVSVDELKGLLEPGMVDFVRNQGFSLMQKQNKYYAQIEKTTEQMFHSLKQQISENKKLTILAYE